MDGGLWGGFSNSAIGKSKRIWDDNNNIVNAAGMQMKMQRSSDSSIRKATDTFSNNAVTNSKSG